MEEQDDHGGDGAAIHGTGGAPGFIAHAGGPGETAGWRVVELWESEDAARTWFDANVRDNLPPDVDLKQTYYPVHTAFTR